MAPPDVPSGARATALLRRLSRRPGPVVCGLVFAALLIAAVAGGQVRTSSATIGVEEITPGMRGYGMTVFRGTTPQRFDVEVIDVLHQFRPDQDLILIRVDHPILDAAHVVAGMSGSPVYFDGRLAGAYAYGWPFSQDPVAGVTPIRNMLSEMGRPVRSDAFPGAQPLGAAPATPRRRGRARASRDPLGLPPYVGAELATATSALDAHANRLGLGPAGRRPSTTAIQPAATPLLLGGLHESVVEELEEQLGRFGLMVLQAGGAGSAASANAPRHFVDGGTVGVQMVRGDIAATAVGTVTHVDGSRLVGFGHPMMNAGQTGLPTAITRVLHILSSQNRSFKISEPVRSLGTLIHDRQACIVVDESLQAASIDARVRVTGVEGIPRDEWNFTVASHRVLSPVLLAGAISNAVTATSSDHADVMIEATSRVWIEGRSEPEEIVDVLYSRAGANAVAIRGLRLFSLLEATYGNPFEVARATRVEVDLALRYRRDTFRIVDASVAGREVDPGSTVPVRVTLRGWDEREEVRVVQVAIPDRLAGQSVQVTFQGGGAIRIEHALARNLDDIFEAIHERYATTSMVVSMRTAQRGLRFGGHVARHLPPSALDTLQLRNDGDRNRPFITYDRREVPLDAVVTGNAGLTLAVRSTPRP